MANARHGSIHYVDSTGTLTSKLEDRLIGVIVTPTAANAVLVLSDTSDAVLLDLRAPTSGSSVFFDFSASPISLAGGLKAKTATNCVASILYTNSRG
jgi:hypothetical protein